MKMYGSALCMELGPLVCPPAIEEVDCKLVEMVLRNLPPVEPFVVRWDWPLFRREESLGDSRLKTKEWSNQAKAEFGVSLTGFFGAPWPRSVIIAFTVAGI